MPQVIREFNFSVKQVGWIAAIPALVTAALMVPWSIHSDRTGERVLHSMFPVLVASLGLLLAAYTKLPTLVVVGFAMASWGLFASIPPFLGTSCVVPDRQCCCGRHRVDRSRRKSRRVLWPPSSWVHKGCYGGLQRWPDFLVRMRRAIYTAALATIKRPSDQFELV